jgi:pimeloyl-ACP methyl ester carboxylesterase
VPPTIVLIHGAWMSPASWEPWRARYAARGYTVLAPAWPCDDRPVAELVASPDPALANVGVTEIVAHYAEIVRGLDAPPVLVGHSFGGLFVQLLLDRGLGAAGVAIDPAPPRGVFPTLDAIRAGWPVVSTWGGGSKIHRLSFADFQWGWMHTQPEAEQRAAYDAFVVPTPGKPYFDAAAAPFNPAMRIDFANPKRAPLLLVAGAEDRTVPASMVRAAHALQKRSPARTDLLEFAGRTHWIIGQPGWEEVADQALAWVEGVLAG